RLAATLDGPGMVSTPVASCRVEIRQVARGRNHHVGVLELLVRDGTATGACLLPRRSCGVRLRRVLLDICPLNRLAKALRSASCREHRVPCRACLGATAGHVVVPEPGGRRSGLAHEAAGNIQPPPGICGRWGSTGSE